MGCWELTMGSSRRVCVVCYQQHSPPTHLELYADALVAFCRQAVSVASIYQDDVEVNAAKGGENLRLRLTGIEEEEMQAGFVVCSRHVPVPCVTYFNAQLQVSPTPPHCLPADHTNTLLLAHNTKVGAWEHMATPSHSLAPFPESRVSGLLDSCSST